MNYTFTWCIMSISPAKIDSSFISSQIIHVLASVHDNVVGIVAAWLRHSITSQTPETEKSSFGLLDLEGIYAISMKLCE